MGARLYLSALALVIWAGPIHAAGQPDPVRAAIEKGLRRIEKGSAAYINRKTCFSCHHQALPILALSSARKRGFAIDDTNLGKQIDFTLDTFRRKKDRVAKGEGVEGASTMAGYALFALEGAGHPADETTAALVQYLLAVQQPDGSWKSVAQRPPLEGSRFTNTALALRGLKAYSPPKAAPGAGKLRFRIRKALRQGRDWLLENEPQTTEDKVFHLRGLVTAGANPGLIAAARDRLLKAQRPDGSWFQLPDRPGDPYATGSVLMALRAAGLKTTNPAYQKGVNYLLATQKPDGSWIVQTRSRPFQTFFDNGDPGGKNQFISFAATSWAVLALLEQYPAR